MRMRWTSSVPLASILPMLALLPFAAAVSVPAAASHVSSDIGTMTMVGLGLFALAGMIRKTTGT